MEKRYAFSFAFISVLSSTPIAHAQWQQVGPVGNAYSVVVHNGLLYAGLLNNGVRRSTDHGATWTDSDMGITSASNWWLASEQGALFCGTQFGAAFRSTDDGATWEDIGLNGVRGFEEHNDTLYASLWYASQVQYSTDGGSTWQNTGAVGANNLWPLTSVGGSLFVGGQAGGVRRTGSTTGVWTASNTGLLSTEVYAFTYLDGTLFAGTGDAGGQGGVYRSDDLGASWTASGVNGQTVYALHAFDGMLYAGTANGGIFLSADTGLTWNAFNDGLASQTVVRLTDDGSYLYAGTFAGVHRYDVGSGLAEREAAQARLLAYPVPCNAVLTTEVHLGTTARVDLQLLDVTGRVVAERHEGVLPAGAHRSTWDLGELAAGPYTCVLVAGDRRYVTALVRD